MKKMILSLLLIGCSYGLFAQVKPVDTTNRNNGNVQTDSLNRMNTDVNRASTDSLNRMNQTNPTNMNNDSMHYNANNAMRSNDTLSTNKAYSAYGATSVNVPANVQNYFHRDYPSVGNVTWQQNGDWYHGIYSSPNGRYTHVYYNLSGATYTMALPLTETYVPDDIISKVSSMYGPTIYDVTTLKGDSAHNVIYQVRLIDNGQVRSQWMAEDGSTIADPFRSDLNTSVSTSTNAAMDSTRQNANTYNNNMNNAAMDSSQNKKVDSTMMNNQNQMNTTDSSQNHMNMSTDSSGKMNSKNSSEKKSGTKSKSGEMKQEEE